MTLYAIAENCYVASRYDSQEDYDDTDDLVIIIHYGLFKDEKKAEKIVERLNKDHEARDKMEGFMAESFEVVALEIS
ncbi:hypothetical protein ACFLQL_00755 [Verrucomicrobiota bacterium]